MNGLKTISKLCVALDIDECVVESPCDTNATCNDNVGSYVCSCNSGFTGDGFNCSGEVIDCDETMFFTGTFSIKYPYHVLTNFVVIRVCRK